MLHMPSPMLLGQGKGYDEWLAHAQSRATGGRTAVSFSATSGTAGLVGTIVTTSAVSLDAGLQMSGSPWSGRYVGFNNAPTVGRIVQHALPSQDEFTAQIAFGGCILLVSESVSNRSVSSYARNGFTSQSDSSAAALRFTECSYWSPVLGRPQTMSPFTGAGPVDYALAW